MSGNYPPTLYEWAGGMPAFERLTDILYTRVEEEPLLAPLFANAGPDHRKYVAQFIAEVFGGPKTYSRHYRKQSLGTECEQIKSKCRLSMSGAQVV